EDDEHDVFFLNRAFASEGAWRIQNVQSVEEAISYLERTGAYVDRTKFPAADLVVSDVSIPGGSGYELLDWIRGHAGLRHLPFILLSGSAQERQVEKASRHGADFCLEKSTDFKELLASVNQLLKSA